MPTAFPKTGTLVEAETFTYYGGWKLDSQFELEMGSPYLLAHGNGIPVADAKTVITIAEGEEGVYNVWVRAKDWVPGHHPGRFNLLINDATVPVDFGANDKDWSWEFGGKVKLRAGKSRLTLHDLTGFGGRCDAIFFSKDSISPPNGVDKQARAWRKRLRGLPEEPVDAGTFDVVVVGGGVVGAAAALTAARLGDRIALVHNSPYLGGNASVEVGLRPRGVRGSLVEEVSDRHPNGDIKAKSILDAEPTATLFMEYTVYNATTTGSRISSVHARHARTSKEIRLRAPIFIDCSGRATLGMYSNAETLVGQESRSEYNESLALQKRDEMHHGNTVFFRTKQSSSPVSFPPVPWATSVAKDFSDLRGQLTRPGVENGPGPQVIQPNHTDDPKMRRRMKGPMTHFWEYGNWLDPYTNGERIRDHLLRAIYGTFSNVKTLEPEKYANLALDWVAFVPATGEFRRYKGDYVLSEPDIRTHKAFRDGVVTNDGAFCLHYPSPDPSSAKYDFRLKDWEWDERDGKPYTVPFRCLYSRNVDNLMMAGKHIR
ncbi:hypothetical protein H2200_006754 [Cladophialophora chaetospira]|uniref:Pyridine nucleotide-disulfide oxidoreductase n=1 Tax=Cladophialophora chaetospira TaxID=386627 RepID=A0AA39CI12_9EURO|nr:hypothetical protein H2200_006754 [Cladophialophora chaetospira]